MCVHWLAGLFGSGCLLGSVLCVLQRAAQLWVLSLALHLARPVWSPSGPGTTHQSADRGLCYCIGLCLVWCMHEYAFVGARLLGFQVLPSCLCR
jgi:hypothetical protein